MVNIVGSYENKYWCKGCKDWSSIKRDISLSSIQRSLIVGSLLGDGGINANFKVEQGLVQKPYVFWKYEILKSLVFTEPKISYRYDPDGNKYAKSWWFRTIRHPLLTEIFNRFYIKKGYKTGRKIVPKDLDNDLDSLGLAVWIMDDGSYSQRNIDISTYSFRLSEVQLLCDILKNKFGVRMLYHRDRDKGYRMYANHQETSKLVEIIKPYIIPSMMYKIGFHNPVTTGSLLTFKNS